MKKFKLFLFALVSFFAVGMTNVHAETTVTKVELSYDTDAVVVTPAYTYSEVSGLLIATPISKLAPLEDDNLGYYVWANTNTHLLYKNSSDVWDSTTQLGASNQIDPSKEYAWDFVVGLQEGYVFDTENLDSIEVYLNGELRTDAIVRGWSEYWNKVDVIIPVELNTDTFIKDLAINRDGENISRGSSLQFTPTIMGYGEGYDEVTYEISEHSSSNTKISSTGLLTIGEDETYDEITVTVTSVANPNFSDEATLTIIDKVLTIDSINISPSTLKYYSGISKSVKLIASVVGSASHEVEWSLVGNASSYTIIDINNYLRISDDETASSFKVICTSVADNSKSAELIVSKETITMVEGISITYDSTYGEPKSGQTYNQYTDDLNDSSKGNIHPTLTDNLGYYIGTDSYNHLYYYDGSGWFSTTQLDMDEEIDLTKVYGIGFDIYANSSKGYDFDPDKLGEIVVTVNGEERDDIPTIIYNSYLHTITVIVPLGENSEPEIDTYDVYFEANGGTGSMDTVLEVVGTYNLPECEFTAPNGYEFAGWATSANGSVISSGSIEVNEDITLYAIWKEVGPTTYTVSFNANGGSGTMSPISGISGIYNIPACAFTAPSGYQFEGWSTSGNGSIISSINVTEDVTFYAIWSPVQVNEYTITFHPNGGTGSMNSVNVSEGTYTLPQPTFTAPEGKIFVGWSFSADGPAFGANSIPVDDNYDLYAIWGDEEVVHTYTVSFNANGGAGTMADQLNVEAGSYVLPVNEFIAPEGMRFAGWATSATGSVISSLTITGDITLYAVWEEVSSEYTYEFLNGDNQEFNANDAVSFSIRIDGDYTLFDSIEIGGLELIRDVDYLVSEGSTIITFTDAGVAKLNTLAEGDYDIVVKFTNGEQVTGSLKVKAPANTDPDDNNGEENSDLNNENSNNDLAENPDTFNNSIYIIGFALLLITGMSAFVVAKKKLLVK